MFPKPRADLKPNTFDFERLPLVKPTGFREYDARWLFGQRSTCWASGAGPGLGTCHELGLGQADRGRP